MNRLSESEIADRRPVWMAISELFLDTSLDAEDIRRIAKPLAASPYQIEKLDDILLWEVYPACRSNFFGVAGEWAGFDPASLEGRILKGPSMLMRAWAGTLGRISLYSSREWQRIKQIVREQRSAGLAHGGA